MSAPSSWNVLATSLEGRRDALLVALRAFGSFRPAGYRNVLIGRVDDPCALPARVHESLGADPLLSTALAKILPVEHTLRFDPVEPDVELTKAIEPLLDRLAPGSFFVRVERRGLKGRLHSPTLERTLGAHVWQALEARGLAPRVDFRDPDAVLVVETLGDTAGIAVQPRTLRERYPFLRVR